MNGSHLPRRDEVRAAYQQGEEAVVELVDGLIQIIASLATRVQALDCNYIRHLQLGKP